MKTILITGCSSGIGYAAAKQLKALDYRVFATARKAEDVERLTSEGLEGIQLDVTDTASMQRALDIITTRTGGTLDALFNNAGILQAGAIEDLSREQIRAQFETNVFGPIELIRLVLPIMRKQGHGRIIQNSSILGVITLPYYGAYNASKFALEGFTNTLRQELYGTDIFVSSINPGPIFSDLRENAFDIYKAHLPDKNQTPHARAYENMEESYFKNRGHSSLTEQPDSVVKYLRHALENPNPHAHYYVGRPAKWMAFAKRILPDRTLDWLLRKIQ